MNNKGYLRLLSGRLLAFSVALIISLTSGSAIVSAALQNPSDPVCGQEEHIHSADCYETNESLVCGLDESEEHTHTDECYAQEESLICGLSEHEHTDECFDISDDSEEDGAAEEVTENNSENNGSDGTSSDMSSGDAYDTEEMTVSEGTEGSDDSGSLGGSGSSVGSDVSDVSDGQAQQDFDPEQPKGDFSELITGVDVTKGLASELGLLAEFSPTAAYALDRTPLQPDFSDSNVTYDPLSDLYSANLRIQFTSFIYQIYEVPDHSFLYEIPDGVIIPDNILDIKFVRDGNDITTGRNLFNYTFIYDDATDRYYILVEFDLNDFSDLPDSTEVGGFIEFSASFARSAVDENGDIKVKFSDDVDIYINRDVISTPDNSTVDKDIETNKQASYNYDTDTITYTVYVTSEKGTYDEINIEDSIAGWEAMLQSGVTVKNSSVSVSKGKVHRVNNSYTDGYSLDAQQGTFSAVLPGLGQCVYDPYPDDPHDNKYIYRDAVCEAYKITYTFELDLSEATGNSYHTLSNSVEATSSNNGEEITDSSESYVGVYVSSGDEETPPDERMMHKSCTVDGTYITWTILLGDGKTSLKNSRLTDEMFSKLRPEDISISPDKGYDVYTNDDGTVDYIEFNGSADLSYTVSYTTKASVGWYGERIQNNASFTYENGSSEGTVNKGAEAYVPGGSVDKEIIDSVDNEDGTHTVYWRVTVHVPELGIPSGTEIRDNLNNTENENHYFSYNDIVSSSGFEALNGKDVSGWAEKVGNLIFFDVNWNSHTYNDIVANRNGASELKYTGFYCLTDDVILPSDCENGESFSYEYSTTVKESALENNNSVSNWASVGGVGSGAKYSNFIRVYKTDGGKNPSPGNITESTVYPENDANAKKLLWRVYVNIDDIGATKKSFTVVDKLPEQVNIDRLLAGYAPNEWYDSYEYIDNKYGDGEPPFGKYTWQGLDLDTSYDKSSNTLKTVITYSGERPSMLMEGGSFYLQYECIIKDEYIDNDTLNDLHIKNHADVTADGKSYGQGDHEHHVQVDTRKKTLGKGYDYIHDSVNELDFHVDVNPYGEDLIPGGTLVLKDTLEYTSYQGHKQGYELIPSSVKLYYAQSIYKNDDNGKSYLDHMEKLDEVPSNKQLQHPKGHYGKDPRWRSAHNELYI